MKTRALESMDPQLTAIDHYCKILGQNAHERSQEVKAVLGQYAFTYRKTRDHLP